MTRMLLHLWCKPKEHAGGAFFFIWFDLFGVFLEEGVCFLLGMDLTLCASYPGIVSLWGMHEC